MALNVATFPLIMILCQGKKTLSKEVLPCFLIFCSVVSILLIITSSCARSARFATFVRSSL